MVLGAVNNPRTHLNHLIGLFHEGCQRALPFFPKSSYAYAESHKLLSSAGKDEETITGKSIEEANEKWNDSKRRGQPTLPGEKRDLVIQRFFEDYEPFTFSTTEAMTLARKVLDPIFNHLED